MSNPDQSPATDERAAFIRWLCESFPAAWTEQSAAHAWDNNEAAVSAWHSAREPLLDAIAELKSRVAPTEAAAMAATVPALDREALTDLIAEHLRDTYHCTRAWGAWGCGTMGEGDFEPVAESDTPAELADAIINKLATKPLTDEQIKAAIDGAVKSGQLSWMGYEKDEVGQYTVPVLSPSHYQLARAIEAALQAPVAGQPAEPSPATERVGVFSVSASGHLCFHKGADDPEGLCNRLDDGVTGGPYRARIAYAGPILAPKGDSNG